MDYRVYMQQSGCWVREFLVELLGALVPGLIFTFLATIVVGYPLVTLFEIYKHQPLKNEENKSPNSTQNQPMPKTTQSSEPNAPGKEATDPKQDPTGGKEQRTSSETHKSLSEMFGPEITILFIAVSFALGSVFFRADPDLPDMRSVWANRRTLIDNEAPAVYFHPDVRSDPRFVWRTFRNVMGSFLGTWPGYAKQLQKEKKLNVKFPYLNLRNYLVHRNFSHLAEMIPWKVEDKGSWGLQTKEFINLLKIRLEFALPDKCSSIVRNEAHIRLMSSVWYMTKLVQVLALLSIGLVLVMLGTELVNHQNLAFVRHLLLDDSVPCLGCLVLIVPAAFYVRHRIEKTLHSQRLREIVYVLETAHFAKVCGIWVPKDAEERKHPEIVSDLGQKKDDDSNPPSSA
jgi:hypothetical protein